MDKQLPKIYHNKINKNISNNSKYFSSSEIQEKKQLEKPKHINIRKKINDIFSSPNYIYKANVTITTKDKTINERIIGRNKNYLITMDNKTIPIDDILDIESN